MNKSFSISPRILSHFGDELIKNESIAILELVKNSYDADAKTCVVEFITDERNNLESITITDDGIGMNKEIIENVWLTVGTDNKLNEINRKENGRMPLGEKGIGRFGVHKLGDKIEIYSKKENSPEIRLYIDWTRLNTVKDIDDFNIEFEENSSEKIISKTGTKIIIKNLKTIWTEKKLNEVYRAINSLNSPFENNSDEFRVEIRSNFSELFEKLPTFEDIKDAAMYFGKCTIEGDKITAIKYQFKPWSSLDKISSGRTKSTNDFEEIELLLSERKQKRSQNTISRINLNNYKIGKIEFEILIFETDPQIFNFVNTEKSSIKLYLKQNGGIRIYRDDMRVYNYGEPDNDWLNIDIKRISRIGGNVSNNIIIGSVKLNRKDSFDLKEKTNREGFVENEAYHLFVEAIDQALLLFVKERNIDKEFVSSLYKNYKEIEPVLSDLNDVEEFVEENVTDKKVKEEIKKYLFRINRQYKNVKDMLLKSANAGLNFSLAIHEIEKIISELLSSITHENYEKAENLSKRLETIITGYSAMIKKSSIKKNKLSKIVNTAIDNYSFRFKDHKIKISLNKKNNDLEAYFSYSEAISVITNILDNSIFWLSYANPENNRIIYINITDEIENFNSIIITDNGPGFNIPIDYALKPFMSGKPHGIGSGLGLYIADEMMKALGGKLLVLDKDEIEIPEIENNKKTTIALCFKTKNDKDGETL